MLTKHLIGLFLLFALLSQDLLAQDVWENPKKEIYSFLSRQAQKGNINLNDYIQPYSRKEIANHLKTLQDSVQKLSPTERAELDFYKKEYGEFNEGTVDESLFIKRDQHGRLRAISVKKGDFLLNAEPTYLLETIQGNADKSFFKLGSGAKIWGHAGKNVSFQAGFIDVTERGTGFDSLRFFTDEPGIVKTSNPNPKLLNYSEFRGNITYSWSNGSITAGNDQILYGYGENGRIILSDKSPAFPFIRLNYQPLSWLQFNYHHSWLHSGIIDSVATYNKGNDIYGNVREQYIPKYMASHSLNFFPVKGLILSIGESVVYSDKLEAGYLFPLMFFKIYDQHASRYKITTGSNSQFFFQASSRNHIKNTHIYASLFIDEIRMSEVLNKEKSRNQIGYNIGASVTDVIFPYLTLGAEYGRLNPFTYQNLMPAQNYTHQGYPLGDWMGANADKFIGYIKYTPMPRIKTSLQVQHVRKGHPGTLFDQYFAEPQPKFLNALELKDTQISFRVSYEWLNNIYFDGSFHHQKTEHVNSGDVDKKNFLRLGMRLGI